MTSKFSRRRTRVQHKPKVCISPKTAVASTLTVTWDCDPIGIVSTLHLTFPIGEAIGPGQYETHICDAQGNRWTIVFGDDGGINPVNLSCVPDSLPATASMSGSGDLDTLDRPLYGGYFSLANVMQVPLGSWSYRLYWPWP